MVLFSRTGLALAALLLAASHRLSAQQSHFAAPTPTIDGQATEWATPLQTDEKTHLQYAVLNDARTVYLRLKTADPATQRRLLFQGLTVWLDSTGRQRQQFGVKFPLGGRMGDAVREYVEGAEAEPAAQARMAESVAGMHEMQLLKYKGSLEPTIVENHTLLGIHAAAAFDAEHNLVYELAVPLRLLYKRGASFAAGNAPAVGLVLVGGPAYTTAGMAPGTQRSAKNRKKTSASLSAPINLKISAQLAQRPMP